MKRKDIKWASIIPLIGGFSLGAEQAMKKKPDCIFSWNAFAKNDSHIRKYWPKVPFHLIDDETYQKPTTPIDIIVATPPCSALSSLNSQSSPDYASIKWVFESAEIAMRDLNVKVFIGENAPGLYTNKGVSVANKLFDLGQKYGYSLTLYHTDLLLHGVPQRRRRTFYFFWKSDEAPVLNFCNVQPPHLEQFLESVPKGLKHEGIFFHDVKDPTELAAWKFMEHKYGSKVHESLLKEAGGYFVKMFYGKPDLCQEYVDFATAHPEYKESKLAIRAYARLKVKMMEKKGIWDQSLTVPRDGHTNAAQGRVVWSTIHPTKNEWIDVRSWMALMGLPNDFELCDENKNSLYAVTQNVSTATAKFVTEEAIAWLEGKRPSSGHKMMKQCNVTQKTEEFYSVMTDKLAAL